MDASKLAPAYLVFGEDELKRQTTIERLKKYVDESLQDFNLTEIIANSQLSIQELLGNLSAMPFGMGKRIVIIREALNLSDECLQALKDYLKAPNQLCCAAFVCAELKKTQRLYKIFSDKSNAAEIVDCTPKVKKELDSNYQRLFAQHGLSINTQALKEFSQRVGNNSLLAQSQIQQLRVSIAPRADVSLLDIQTYVKQFESAKPWEFQDAIGERDIRRVFEYVSATKDGEIFFVRLITERLRELLCIKESIEMGQGNLAAAELGKQEWQLRSVRKQAQKFSLEELVHLIVLSADVDYKLKSNTDKNFVFTQYLLEVCGG